MKGSARPHPESPPHAASNYYSTEEMATDMFLEPLTSFLEMEAKFPLTEGELEVVRQ